MRVHMCAPECENMLFGSSEGLGLPQGGAIGIPCPVSDVPMFLRHWVQIALPK